MYVKRNSSKAKKSTRSYKKKSSRTVSSKVKNYVKKAVRKNVEIKYSDNSDAVNKQMITYQEIGNVVPTFIDLAAPLKTIAQGVGEGDRIGTQITLTSLPFKCLIRNPIGEDGVSQLNVGVKFIIARLKSGLQTPTSDQIRDLFQAGSGASSPENTYLDLLTPFNKDVWSIKKTYTFKLSKLANAEQNLTPLSGHGMLKVISLDLAKYFPKQIKYYNGTITGTGPTNVGLYGFIVAGDTIGSDQNLISVRMDYQSWARFTDE